MERPLFIGDELSAAGYRLPGLRVMTPDRDGLSDVFASALHEAPLVIITTALANVLPGGTLAEAIKRASSPVAVVPEATAANPMPDMAQRVRLALGVDT